MLWHGRGVLNWHRLGQTRRCWCRYFTVLVRFYFAVAVAFAYSVFLLFLYLRFFRLSSQGNIVILETIWLQLAHLGCLPRAGYSRVHLILFLLMNTCRRSVILVSTYLTPGSHMVIFSELNLDETWWIYLNIIFLLLSQFWLFSLLHDDWTILGWALHPRIDTLFLPMWLLLTLRIRRCQLNVSLWVDQFLVQWLFHFLLDREKLFGRLFLTITWFIDQKVFFCFKPICMKINFFTIIASLCLHDLFSRCLSGSQTTTLIRRTSRAILLCSFHSIHSTCLLLRWALTFLAVIDFASCFLGIIFARNLWLLTILILNWSVCTFVLLIRLNWLFYLNFLLLLFIVWERLWVEWGETFAIIAYDAFHRLWPSHINLLLCLNEDNPGENGRIQDD